MDKIIKEQLGRFEQSIDNYDSLLIESFKLYMNDIISILNSKEFFINNCDENRKKELFIRNTNKVIELPLEEKKRRLIKDDNYDKILSLSEKYKTFAEKIYLGEKIDEEFNNENCRKELIEYLSKVEEFNQSRAKILVSEGVMDSYFIENPNNETTSFRLATFIKNTKIKSG